LLKEILAELSITQELFAHELNVSFSTLNRWENGHTAPSHLAKMCLLEFCMKQNLSHNLTENLEKLYKLQVFGSSEGMSMARADLLKKLFSNFKTDDREAFIKVTNAIMIDQ
jgi:transcriptional regulator with XRE-family HTH domain